VDLYGGAGSGKSQAICQELVDRFFDEEDIRVLVIRKTGPSLNTTTYQMLKDTFVDFGYKMKEDYILNKTEKTFSRKNNLIWCQSLDDEKKKKSLNINYAYIEEATEVSKEDYMQLELRLRRENSNGINQMLLSHNPTDEYHWTKTDIIDRADGKTITVLHSSAADNPFLPRDYRQKLERLFDLDEEYYRMYALGEYVTIKHQIYSNYIVEDFVPEGTPFSIGLDFGYNNPCAMVAIYLKDNELFLQELLYEKHLTNSDLVRRLQKILVGPLANAPIYADSAEPDKIEEICRAGFNCIPAYKDVSHGIDRCKKFKLHILPQDTDLLNELRSYKWREKRGQVLDEPVPINDHLMDAFRYAVASSGLETGSEVVNIKGESLRRRNEILRGIPGFDSTYKVGRGSIPRM